MLGKNRFTKLHKKKNINMRKKAILKLVTGGGAKNFIFQKWNWYNYLMYDNKMLLHLHEYNSTQLYNMQVQDWHNSWWMEQTGRASTLILDSNNQTQLVNHKKVQAKTKKELIKCIKWLNLSRAPIATTYGVMWRTSRSSSFCKVNIQTRI